MENNEKAPRKRCLLCSYNKNYYSMLYISGGTAVKDAQKIKIIKKVLESYRDKCYDLIKITNEESCEPASQFSFNVKLPRLLERFSLLYFTIAKAKSSMIDGMLLFAFL